MEITEKIMDYSSSAVKLMELIEQNKTLLEAHHAINEEFYEVYSKMIFMETARNEFLDRIIALRVQENTDEDKKEAGFLRLKMAALGKVNSEMPKEVKSFNQLTRGL